MNLSKNKDSNVKNIEISSELQITNDSMYEEKISSACQSNSDCLESEFCTATLFADGEGLCVSRPE